MFVRKLASGLRRRTSWIFICTLAASGCGTGILPGDDGVLSTLGASVDDPSRTHQETAVNDLLELAEYVAVADEPEFISGRISGSSDVDVYDLGPVEAGDRVRVSVTADRELQGAIALFDDHGATLLVNDHRNVYLGQKGPFIDVTMRRPSESCLVAISATPGFDTSGDYMLGASIEFPAPIPTPHPDVVLLDFDGGRDVRISTRPSVDVPAFDAADIDASFDGDTNALVRRIVEKVREDFAAYNVTILSTSEGSVADDTVTIVYFGRFDPALLGVAEGIDEYNAQSGQSAIVFTDTFAAFMPLRPTVGTMSQAIANVASHEIGHLLGLVHTQDPTDIMDVTASLRALTVDQDFGLAPIYEAVFPIGSQDSAQLLLDSVGGDASLAYGKVQQRSSVRPEIDWDEWAPPARSFARFGTCCLRESQH